MKALFAYIAALIMGFVGLLIMAGAFYLLYKMPPNTNYYGAVGLVVFGGTLLTCGLFFYVLEFVLLTLDQVSVLGSYLASKENVEVLKQRREKGEATSESVTLAEADFLTKRDAAMARYKYKP